MMLPTIPAPLTEAYEEVELLGATISKGETYRGVCPKCGGGLSKEKSLAVSRTDLGRIFWKCFRGKCSWSGTLNGGTVVSTGIALPFKKYLRIFTRPVEELDSHQIRW